MENVLLENGYKKLNRDKIQKDLEELGHTEFRLPLDDFRPSAYSHIQPNDDGSFYTMIYLEYGVERDTGAPIGDEIEENHATLDVAFNYLEDFINAEEDF